MCLCVVAAARVACTEGSIDQTPTVSENGLSTSSTGQTLASLFRQGKCKENLGCLQKKTPLQRALLFIPLTEKACVKWSHSLHHELNAERGNDRGRVSEAVWPEQPGKGTELQAPPFVIDFASFN